MPLSCASVEVAMFQMRFRDMVRLLPKQTQQEHSKPKPLANQTNTLIHVCIERAAGPGLFEFWFRRAYRRSMLILCWAMGQVSPFIAAELSNVSIMRTAYISPTS